MINIDPILYKNEKGELHREDGPAVIHYNGDTCWYYNGNLHNDNGPAIVHSNVYKGYYHHGTQYSRVGFLIRKALKWII